MDNKATVLIVDDEPIIRSILEGLLTSQEYDLLFATNGLEALAVVEKNPLDLILLDIMMPELDGFQVCQQLKAHDKWRHIPVILVTALDSKEDLSRGLDAGADDFVHKPFDNQELLARVRSMLRTKRQYDLLEEQRQQLETTLQLKDQFAQVTAQHLDELEKLHKLGLQLMTRLDTDSVLSLISDAVLQIIPEAEQCIMHLVVEAGDQLLPIVFAPHNGTKLIYPSVGIEQVVWQALRARDSVYIRDILSTPPCLEPHFDTMRSLLVAPLLDSENSIGTVSVCSAEVEGFQETHRRILSILANQATIAIAKARFFEERRRSQEREKHAIRSLFQRYVSPAVVERLVDSQEDLALGGKRQQVSILFADIRGFTEFSEYLAPESVVEVLNQYLALAVEPILAEEGTLDKFMGDALMALFNAPLLQPDSTLRAIRAALAMQQAIAAYNRATADHQSLSFGTGIHVGQAVVGNIGTTQQMNFTAIGDTINLAKRLQENARGGEILLSQAAYREVQDVVVVEDLGSLAVKGRAAAEHVYSLKGLNQTKTTVPN
jgi:class 3 adenylate cyclase/DNA-binding response OmpR family regulator